MTRIKELDEEIRRYADATKVESDSPVNVTLLQAYWQNLEIQNDLINFGEIIWDHDVEDIIQTLRENGILEFTISTFQGKLVELLAAFDKSGAVMSGLTEVKANYTDWETETYARIPAIKMIIKEEIK